MREPGYLLGSTIADRINAADRVNNWVPGVSIAEIPYSWEAAALNFLPKFDLKALSTPRTVVAPRSRTMRPAGRAALRKEVTIAVMVIAKLDKERSQFDQLIDFVYSIDELVSVMTDLGVTGTTNSPLYDQALLDESLVFRSVLEGTFAGHS
jgi:hypothetical protein